MHLLKDMIDSLMDEVQDCMAHVYMTCPDDSPGYYIDQERESEIAEYAKEMAINILCGRLRMIDIENEESRKNFAYYYRKFLIAIKSLVGLARATRFNFYNANEKLIGVKNVSERKKVFIGNNSKSNIQSTG